MELEKYLGKWLFFLKYQENKAEMIIIISIKKKLFSIIKQVRDVSKSNNKSMLLTHYPLDNENISLRC